MMEPKFLGGAKPDCRGKDRRAVLADWLTAPDNPYFAPSVANRIWAHFFGVGIVEPVDDVRVSNPPINPELYQQLGRKLVEYKYDFKRLVRDICLSQTYQRTTITNASNEGDQRNFAHARVRRVQAEMIRDCISEVTEHQGQIPRFAAGGQGGANRRRGHVGLFPDDLRPLDAGNGLAPATSAASRRFRRPCTCSTATPCSRRFAAGSVIQNLLAAKKSPEEIIRVLYVRCLTPRAAAGRTG